MLLQRRAFLTVSLGSGLMTHKLMATEHPARVNGDTALLLLLRWAGQMRDPDPMSRLKVTPGGNWRIHSAGALFEYVAQDGVLKVGGLVSASAKTFAELPALWDPIVEASIREHESLGGGKLAIVHQAWPDLPHLPPPIALLRLVFPLEAPIDEHFVARVEWILEWAAYWRRRRLTELLTRTRQQAEAEAPSINTWIREHRKRPW